MLSHKDTTYFRKTYTKASEKFFKPSTTVIKEIIQRSKISRSVIDNEPLNIHFLNGYWSFADNSFHVRSDVHYVTKVIGYNLDIDLQHDTVTMDGISRSLALPFPSPDALNYFVYGVALSMKNIPANNFFVLLGKGGNGKTTFTSILRTVFEHYCVCLPSVCLDSITDANKSVEGIHSDTLFVFIDEIRAKAAKKSSLLKKLSDGYLMYNRLYQSGSFEISTRAKLIINSNSPLSFDDDDEAIRSRVLYWKFEKRFTKSASIPVDNVTVFSAVDNLPVTLSSTQKSAIFLYFALHAKRLDISIHYPIPSDILTKNQLVNWKDFVDQHFVLRKNSYVTNDLVFRLFKETYPDFEYTSRDIIKVLVILLLIQGFASCYIFGFENFYMYLL